MRVLNKLFLSINTNNRDQSGILHLAISSPHFPHAGIHLHGRVVALRLLYHRGIEFGVPGFLGYLVEVKDACKAQFMDVLCTGTFCSQSHAQLKLIVTFMCSL